MYFICYAFCLGYFQNRLYTKIELLDKKKEEEGKEGEKEEGEKE